MGNEIPEDPFRTIARERSHEEAKQTVTTNRMLVQSLILINGGAAITALPKTWFITGTSSGFGRTLTEKLLARRGSRGGDPAQGERPRRTEGTIWR
jgi:hypothetical protein